MAFTNDDKQEIKAIVQEVIDEQADPIEDTTQVDALEEGDIVAIVRAVGGVNSYKKASVGLFGGGGGSSITVDSALSTTSKNPVQNKVVTAALNSKQATLIGSGSGQNIKTVNGQSLLGTGDIPVSGGAGTVPVITATATVDATTGTPAVSVVKSGTDAAPNFAFAFTGLKGEPGSGGGGGGTGTVTGAKVGQEGTVINPDQNGVLTFPAYEANADVTDAENVKNALGVQQGGTRYLKEDGSWDTPAGGGGGTHSGTKVYLAANGGVLPAMESTNVVYVISYAYTISGSVTVPAGCALEFAGGSINGGTLVLNGTYLYGNIKFGTGITISGTLKNDTIYPEWWGAVGDGITDDTAAFTAMANFITAMDGYRISILPKTYLISSSIYMKGNIEIVGQGDNSVIHLINGAGIKIGDVSDVTILNTTITEGDITLHGKTSSGSDVECTAVSPGATTLTVSDASVFEVNELYVIFDSCDYSFTTARSYYRQGEIIRIKSKDTTNNTITLYNGLYGTYGTDTNFEGYIYESDSRNFTQKFFTGIQGLSHRTLFCKYNFRKVNISNLKIMSESYVAGGETYSLNVQCVKDSLFTGLHVINTGGNKVAVSINMSYKSAITNSRIFSDSTVGSGDFYGLTLISSQHFIASNSTVSGRDHSIMMGGASSVGAIINRDFVYDAIRVDPVGSTNIVIDVHAMAENYTIRNIDCPTYLCDTGGYNVTIENCRFKGISTSFHCAGLKVINCYCETIQELLAYNSPWRNYLDYDMVVDGCTITGGTACFSLNGQKQSYKINNLIVRNCIIKGEIRLRYNIAKNIIIDGNEITTDSACFMFYDRRNDADDTICIRNNKLVSTANKAISIGYAQDMSSTSYGYLGECVISDNVIRNNSSAVSCVQAASLNKCVITNNVISQSGTTANKYLFDLYDDNDAIIDRNIVENVSVLLRVGSTNLSTYNVRLGQNNIVSKYTYTKAGTGTLNIPVGVESMKPTTLGENDAGYRYFNTTTKDYETWNGSSWITSSVGTANYSTTTYDVSTTSDNGNTSGTVTIDGTKALTVLAITGDVTSLALASGKTPEAGHSAHVILSATSARSVTLVHNASTCICPKSANLTLSVTAGGYAEVDFINANNKIYVRGV